MRQADFQKLVWDFYEAKGRHDLPWRQTTEPYPIYISEMMLQQTQAGRVTQKYENWLAEFPDFRSVAEAKKSEILKHWQGLGYNRRALFIKEACEIVMDEYDSKLPQDEDALLALPGIGPYTAGAIQAFVFNLPVVFVETNIRTVFIHHFFADEKDISDAAIKDKVAETLPEENDRAVPDGVSSPFREWYWALMDYGSHLKKEVGNINNQASSYQKQSKFAGSNRQLRAEMTRFILANEPTTLEKLEDEFNKLVERNDRMKPVGEVVATLTKEGFLKRADETITTSD